MKTLVMRMTCAVDRDVHELLRDLSRTLDDGDVLLLYWTEIREATPAEAAEVRDHYEDECDEQQPTEDEP